MKVIVIANQKGGIGKTTTATALSSILTSQGHKTLLIDADQQGNSTDTYRAQIEGAATLYDVLLEDQRININEAIQKTDIGDIIASDPLLRKGDEIIKNDMANGAYRLKDALDELTGYDFVIIDTAPALSSILHNCLVAADEIIIPLTADRYGLQGLSQLHETIKAIQKRQNPNLKISGLLLVKYSERTLLSREVKNELEHIAANMKTSLFETKIRECTKTREAQAIRKSIIAHAPDSTTALDYIQFTKELLKED